MATKSGTTKSGTTKSGTTKSDSPKIVRFHRGGLNNKKIQDWGDFAADRRLIGRPRESGYNFYTDRTKQLIAGVWECTAGVVSIDGFPTDEFCILLEGSVTITDKSGHAETFGPGDGFFIPKGFVGTWNMPVTVRKYYVIFEDKLSAKAETAKARPAAKPALKRAAARRTAPPARKSAARKSPIRKSAAGR